MNATQEPAASDASEPEVAVYASAAELAGAAAGRLVQALPDALGRRESANLVLTGGGIGTATLRALAEHPDRDTVDWARLNVWWGDERFVAASSEDRNELGARDALLDRVGVPSARVYAMPSVDGMDGTDVDAAAARYAGWLSAAAPGAATVPEFDVLLLGVGPDGHVASLFPGQPALAERERPAVAVRDAPKPPPTRISLTYPAIARAREVWLLAAGREKAAAVSAALADDADVSATPAAGAHGTLRTWWLLDQAAAGDLPTH